jgi:hypothetical protein
LLSSDHCPISVYYSRIFLPPRDDAAEFDEGGVDLAGHVDDREVVLWRKSNKVSMNCIPVYPLLGSRFSRILPGLCDPEVMCGQKSKKICKEKLQ